MDSISRVASLTDRVRVRAFASVSDRHGVAERGWPFSKYDTDKDGVGSSRERVISCCAHENTFVIRAAAISSGGTSDEQRFLAVVATGGRNPEYEDTDDEWPRDGCCEIGPLNDVTFLIQRIHEGIG